MQRQPAVREANNLIELNGTMKRAEEPGGKQQNEEKKRRGVGGVGGVEKKGSRAGGVLRGVAG